jgi:hypothetical protein
MIPAKNRTASPRGWLLVLNLLIVAVAAHSIVLGVLLLYFPVWTLSLVGWEYRGELFWPSQAGLFLVILGIAYAAAVRIRAFVWLAVGSKASAFVFLAVSPALLGAPRMVGLTGCGDGVMGLALAAVLWRVCSAERRTRPSTPCCPETHPPCSRC